MQETVKDIMSKDVVAVMPNDSAEVAAKLMSEYDIGSIPVIAGGELKGLLTDRDIVVRCISKGKSANSTKVSDLMTTDVVNNGFVDGMVSLADIARIHSGPEIASALTEISKKTPSYRR